jgi:glyceraldehyde 3-phosphate dehydrogenase
MILRSQAHRLIAVNDLADRAAQTYLLERDSVHGGFKADLSGVKFSCAQTPQECDFDGAEVVLDCTGVFTAHRELEAYLDRGAKRVVISALSADESVAIAPPLSKPEAAIVSAGSCTANALYAMSNVMNDHFGVAAVLATSIHSYTSDQRVLDGRNDDRRRGRASAINIIPVVTSAAKNLIRYDPTYANKAAAIGLRIPAPNVSMMQAVFALKNAASDEAINAAFTRSQNAALSVTSDYKVSTDIIGSTASAIVDTNLTLCLDRLACVCAWHDNEIGFAARMLEFAKI